MKPTPINFIVNGKLETREMIAGEVVSTPLEPKTKRLSRMRIKWLYAKFWIASWLPGDAWKKYASDYLCAVTAEWIEAATRPDSETSQHSEE